MPKCSAKERVARVAARQFGRVSWAQLVRLGISDSTIALWVGQGYLYRVLPRVYAVGHRARTAEAGLAAAVLYAGPGAMLSHATAAWWVGLADSEPHLIHVSTPRRCRSLPGIRVYPRRAIERQWRNRLPVTPFTQTLIDYAGQVSLTKLRRALAKADYDGGLNVGAIQAELGHGRPGSAALRCALRRHHPRLGRTRSGLEIVFADLCEQARVPLPEINADVAGWTVDALWRKERVAVEVDGWRNHRTPAQIRRDRRKEFALRAARFVVLRYSDDQVDLEGPAVMAEIQRSLSPPAPSA